MGEYGFVNIQVVVNSADLKQTTEELHERVFSHETTVNLNTQFRPASHEEELELLSTPPWEVQVPKYFEPPPTQTTTQDKDGEEVWKTYVG